MVEPYVTENTFFDKDVVLMARDAWSKDINVMIGGSSYEGLMMSYSLNVLNVSKPVDVLRNTNYFTPSYELGLDVNGESCAKYGKILKQLYYGCTQPSRTNTEDVHQIVPKRKYLIYIPNKLNEVVYTSSVKRTPHALTMASASAFSKNSRMSFSVPQPL